MTNPQTTTEKAYIDVGDLAKINIAIGIARDIYHPVGKELLKLLYPIQAELYGAVNVRAD